MVLMAKAMQSVGQILKAENVSNDMDVACVKQRH